MRSTLRHVAAPLLTLALAVVVAACQSPLNHLPTTKTIKSTLLPHQSRLVVHTSASAKAKWLHDLSEAHFLTLQLTSIDDGSTQFAKDSDTGTPGTFELLFEGLPEGDYKVNALLYNHESDTKADPRKLYFYANKVQFVRLGTDTPLELALYEPGSLESGPGSASGHADHITVFDQNGDTSEQYSSDSRKILPRGTTWNLDALLFETANEDFPLADEDQGMEWESSDPTVAPVSTVGVVTALSPGDADITARSILHPTLTRTYSLRVTSGLEGIWKSVSYRHEEDSNKPDKIEKHSTVFVYRDGDFYSYDWDSWDEDYTAERGTYEVEGDLVKVTLEDELVPGARSWTPIPADDDREMSWDMQYRFSGDRLGLFSDNFLHATSNLNLVYNFKSEVPVDLVSINLAAPVPGSLAEGDHFDGHRLEYTPSYATIDKGFWVSYDSGAAVYGPTAVVDFNPDGYTADVDLYEGNNAQARGFGLGPGNLSDWNNDAPVLLRLIPLSVVANTAPTITGVSFVNGSTGTETLPSLELGAGDAETGIASIYVKNIQSGLAAPVDLSNWPLSDFTTEGTPITRSINLDPDLAIPAVDGDYDFQVTVTDRQGLFSTFDLTYTYQSPELLPPVFGALSPNLDGELFDSTVLNTYTFEVTDNLTFSDDLTVEVQLDRDGAATNFAWTALGDEWPTQFAPAFYVSGNTWQFSLPAFTLAQGAFPSLRYRATDLDGNTSPWVVISFEVDAP